MTPDLAAEILMAAWRGDFPAALAERVARETGGRANPDLTDSADTLTLRVPAHATAR